MPKNANASATLNPLNHGASRAITQFIVYPFDSIKTRLMVPHLPVPLSNPPSQLKGILQASVCTGLVYFIYFGIQTTALPYIGPAAAIAGALIASTIRVPLANTIRLIQTGNAATILSAGQKIIRRHGIGGLQRGFLPSLAEDFIETELKMVIYAYLRKRFPTPSSTPANGALAGGIAAAATTPFDVIKTNMSLNRASLLGTSQILYGANGSRTFFRGCHMRAFNCALKSALAFYIYECLCSASASA